MDENHYRDFRRYLDHSPVELKKKLKTRILFGSDFMINLTGVESYNKYLEIFSRSPYFNSEEKHGFCAVNPEKFLFGEKVAVDGVKESKELTAV